jgi:serine protease
MKLGGLMDMYVAYERIPTPSDYDKVSNNEGNIETITISQPAAGRWYVNLVPNDRSFENIDLLAHYESTQIQQKELTLNTPVENLHAAQGESIEFYLDVADNLSSLDFSISGGTGDADLYVGYQLQPSLTRYDCRPYKNGNQETCRFDAPKTGRYYIRLVAYQEFSGVSLVAKATRATGNSGQLQKLNLSAATGEWQHFTLALPEGISNLTVTISGGTGDADLYLNLNQPGSYSDYQCRPYRYGNQETCNISAPQAGIWYISINGYTGYSGLKLNASWQ